MLNLGITIIRKLVIGIIALPFLLAFLGILLTPVGGILLLAYLFCSGEDKKVCINVQCSHGTPQKKHLCTEC